MDRPEKLGSPHECLSDLLHALGIEALVEIACAAEGATAMPIVNWEYRNARIEVLGLAKAARIFAVDLVYTIHLADGRLAALWIFEVDLSRSRVKPRRWSLYLSAFENEFDVDGKLAIFAPKPKLREYLRTKACPVSRVDPILVEPDHIERITDYDQARRRPRLAVLSCLFHAQDPAPAAARIEVVKAAWMGLQTLPPKEALRYGRLIMDLVDKPIVASSLEQLHASGELDASDVEAWAESVRGGYSYELGQEETRRELLREAIVDLLEARGLTLTAGQREQVGSCESIETLERWRAAAKTARAVEQALL